MKVLEVRANNRRRCFEIKTRSREYVYPFVECDPCPTTADPLVKVYVDPEVGNEGFTFELKSGQEGTVLMDDVLDCHRDPVYMKKLALHMLTVKALHALKASGLAKREVIRRLNTSPTQLYRLLDPACYSKSVDEMLRLLWVLGQSVEINVLDQTA